MLKKKKLISERVAQNQNCKTEVNENGLSEMKIMENSGDVHDYLMNNTKDIEPKQLIYSR